MVLLGNARATNMRDSISVVQDCWKRQLVRYADAGYVCDT
jgi:hypothetical protein